MRDVLSISVAACFVLISALANFSNTYASEKQDQMSGTQIAVISTPEVQSIPADEASTGENQASVEDDDCPCKNHLGSAKFLCGVALALLDNPAALHSPLPSKTKYMLVKSAAVSDYVDRLKRPPRTIL
ncbi:MAG: hypothetical protein GKR97_08610 [Rhizobiaceae bacterium]|nr:hypothetical protein [Rhizobiaceae bacterium]